MKMMSISLGCQVTGIDPKYQHWLPFGGGTWDASVSSLSLQQYSGMSPKYLVMFAARGGSQALVAALLCCAL